MKSMIFLACALCVVVFPHALAKEYFMATQSVNWFGAVEYCTSIGMQLATVSSQYEQNILEAVLANSGGAPGHVWIGASDLSNKGEFVWLPTATAVNYTNWIGGAPNSGNTATSRCVDQYNQDGIIGWWVRDCFDILWVACEFV